MDMNIVFIVGLFILWTIFGSFWWVLISREWDNKWIKSIFFGRSKCTKCKKNLSFTELIPLLSFFLQKWKCNHCGFKLPNIYRIIEILSWLIFVLTYLLLPYHTNLELLFWIFVNRSFLLLLIFDIQKHELHLPTRIIITIMSILFTLLKIDFIILAKTTLSFFLMFLIIYFFSKYYMKIRFKKQEEWFGQWDVFLSFTIWVLSWFVFYNWVEFGIVNLIDLVLIYVILSCIIWLIYAIVNRFLFFGHKQIIPFLPSMIMAYWIILLFGNILIKILQ
jgi:prepilin signal peptidase PulO-like enzyme (type II secretory pathway)